VRRVYDVISRERIKGERMEKESGMKGWWKVVRGNKRRITRNSGKRTNGVRSGERGGKKLLFLIHGYRKKEVVNRNSGGGLKKKGRGIKWMFSREVKASM